MPSVAAGCRYPVPDPALGLTDHLDHSALDEAPGAFEPGVVEFLGNLDRLTPKIDAAAEGPREMKAVPGREHSPPTGRVGDRHDRHPGEPGEIDDPGARAHRRAARPVRRDPDAISRLEPLQHCPQRGGAAAAGRAGDRIDAEIGHRIGDDLPVAMSRYQHVHRREPLPCHWDHQQPPMPEGEDERLSFGAQAVRPFAALDAPAGGQIDEADIPMDEPARHPAQPGIAQKPPQGDRSGQSQPRASTRRRRVARQTASHKGGHKARRGPAAPHAGRSRRSARDRRRRSGPPPDRRQPMRDDERRAPANQRVQRSSALAARIRCRAPRSPRRAAGSARSSASRGQSRFAGAGRPRAGRRARRPSYRSPAAARG